MFPSPLPETRMDHKVGGIIKAQERPLLLKSVKGIELFIGENPLGNRIAFFALCGAPWGTIAQNSPAR